MLRHAENGTYLISSSLHHPDRLLMSCVSTNRVHHAYLEESCDNTGKRMFTIQSHAATFQTAQEAAKWLIEHFTAMENLQPRSSRNSIRGISSGPPYPYKHPNSEAAVLDFNDDENTEV